MNDWLSLIQSAGRPPWVLVTVAAVRGSVPREPGAAIVVTGDSVLGTIGGGTLEHEAITLARRVLDGAHALPPGGQVHRYVLGTDFSQCCGGVAFLHYDAWLDKSPAWLPAVAAARDNEAAVTVITHPGRAGALIVTDEAVVPVAWQGAHADPHGCAAVIEARTRHAGSGALDLLWSPSGAKPREPDADGRLLMRTLRPGGFRLILCGAGHVGRAVVKVIAPLVDRIDWCDARPGEFPPQVAANVHTHTGDAFEIIARQPAGGFYLVMTHNHSLDLLLCEAVLARADFAYLGLIGSASKRQRFERHLREAGYGDDALARLICPIGIAGIHSKVPEAIAIGVGAQLLQVHSIR